MTLLLAHVKANLQGYYRNRGAMFFAVIFPAVLFLMFGHQEAPSRLHQVMAFVLYANYAVQSVMLMSLGIGTSMSRNSDWTLYVKTLPVSPGVVFVSRMLMYLFMSTISLIVVLVCSFFVLSVHISILMWVFVIVVALLGGIPMAFLGFGLGQLVNPSAARNVFVILNLALLFACTALPGHGILGYLLEAVPSYQWMMIVGSHVQGIAGASVSVWKPWLWMFGYTIVFYWFATWAYKRQRNTRFE